MRLRFILISLLVFATAHGKDGIVFSGYFATDIGGNPVGGERKSTIYSGFLDVGVAFDFEELACVEGLALTVNNFLASGQNLSASIGNFFGVQEVYAQGNYFFGVFDLSLSINGLTIEAGRLLAGDVFMRSELSQFYLTSGINGNLEAIESNIVFPSYNIAAWATRVTYEPSRHWQLIGALYNTPEQILEANEHGLYLNMDRGTLAIAQVNCLQYQTREENGLPGMISVGGYYSSNTYQDLSDSTQSHNGNYGFYFMFDQMVWRGEWQDFEGPSHLRSGASFGEKVKHPRHRQQVVAFDRPQGLTVWGAAYFAPEDKSNVQTYQMAGGLLYQGLIRCRPRDVTAFLALRGKFSDQLKGQEAETVFELNHRFQFNPKFYLTPDLQYVIKPNGRTDISNAWVLGIEMCVNF